MVARNHWAGLFKHRSVHYCTVRGDFDVARVSTSCPYVDHLRAAVISDGLDIPTEVDLVILPAAASRIGT